MEAKIYSIEELYKARTKGAKDLRPRKRRGLKRIGWSRIKDLDTGKIWKRKSGGLAESSWSDTSMSGSRWRDKYMDPKYQVAPSTNLRRRLDRLFYKKYKIRRY